MAILRYGTGESVSIDLSNADFNSDVQADISGVLPIFQKEAGLRATL